MEINNNNQETQSLITIAHQDIYRSLNVMSIVYSSIYVVVGIVSIIISYEIDSSILDMLFLTIGAVALLVALVRFIFKRKAYVYRPTGSVLKSGELFFDSKDVETMRRALENTDFSIAEKIRMTALGNARIEYIVSKDMNFVGVQLAKYVPYTYHKVMEPCYFTGNMAKLFVKTFIKKD